MIAKEWTEEKITGMEFVKIPGSCFDIGSPDTETGRNSDEGPVKNVCVDEFLMGKYEVTNEQFRKYKKHDSGSYGGFSFNEDKQPAVNVSWEDAMNYAKWLSDKSGYTFSLPTEAEWEYACRAGTKTSRFWGYDSKKACDYANVYDETGKKQFNFSWESHECTDNYKVSSPVGKFKPNEFQLHDMLGNVWEWCLDQYDSEAYKKLNNKEKNPIFVQNSIDNLSHNSYNIVTTKLEQKDTGSRTLRGGSWDGVPRVVRCAARGRLHPDNRLGYWGFRLVRRVSPQ